MNIGPLYKIKKFYWFLFPTKSLAVSNGYAISKTDASNLAISYRNTAFNNITYMCPNDLIVFIEEDGKQHRKILTTDGRIGWIVFAENIYSDCFEEVKST